MIKKNPTYEFWLNHEHSADFQNYLYQWVDKHSHDAVRAEFKADPYLGYSVIKDWVRNRENPRRNLEKLIDYIKQPAVFNILVRGMPDSGKTTTVWALADKLNDQGYNIVLIAPYVEEETLPEFVSWVPKIFDLNKGDVGIIDEAALKMSQRNSMTKNNKDAFITMPVGRHIGAKIILITQMSSETDIKALRWANVMISKSFSTSAIGEKSIERNIISDNPVFEYLKPADNYAMVKSSKKDWSIVTMSGTNFMLYLPKPPFMTDKLSRTYRKISEILGTNEKLQIEEFAMKKAKFMRDNGYPAMTIYQELGIRGYWKTLEYWMQYTGEIQLRRDIVDLDDIGNRDMTVEKLLRKSKK